MGNVIPFDGEVSDGEGMVNQASLTGEAVPVRRVSGRVFMPELYWKKENLPDLVKAVADQADLKNSSV